MLNVNLKNTHAHAHTHTHTIYKFLRITIQEGSAGMWSKGIASLILSLCTGWWVVNTTPRSLYLRERTSLPNVQEATWAPGLVWRGADNLACTGILTPNHPACDLVAIPTACLTLCKLSSHFSSHFIVQF